MIKIMMMHRHRRKRTNPKIVFESFTRNRRTYDVKGEIDVALNGQQFLSFVQENIHFMTSHAIYLTTIKTEQDFQRRLSSIYASIKSIEQTSRLLSQYFNDRIAWLWTVKDQHFRCLSISILFRTIVHTLAKLEEILQNLNIVECRFHFPANLMCVEVVTQFQRNLTKVFQSCLTYAMTYCIKRNIQSRLDKLFSSNKQEFCGMNHQWKWIPTSMIACTKITPSQDRLEEDIIKALIENGVDPIWSIIPKIFSGVNELRNSRMLISCGFNASVEGLLESILSNQLLFDEAGLYKLYRLLLKLQEYVDEYKRKLELHRDEHLIEDVVVWKQAQSAIDQLNDAIFERKKQPIKTKEKVDNSTVEWKHLVNQSDVGTISNWLNKWKQWQKRHKGTIFVSLVIDVNNL